MINVPFLKKNFNTNTIKSKDGKVSYNKTNNLSSEENSRLPLGITQNESNIEILKLNLFPDRALTFGKHKIIPNPVKSKFQTSVPQILNHQSNKISQNEIFRQLTLKDKIDDSGSSEADSDKEIHNNLVILPLSIPKQIWDILVGTSLLYTSIVTPYLISFIDDYSSANKIIDYIDIFIDVIFIIDMILSFFTAYMNKEDKLEKKHNKITVNYLKGWFVIDFISIFPINAILKNSTSGSSSKLSDFFIGFSKIPKLYRLFKLMKLFRMVRVLKMPNTSRITRKVFSKCKLNMHLERLLYYLFGLLLFIHISACIFFFIAKLEDFSPDTWVTRLGYIDYDPFQLYIISFYWSLTTVTTVGYGDVSSVSLYERIYNLFIMSFGVVIYSFAIGFISSIVAMIDRKTSEINSKMEALYAIKKEYDIDDEIFQKVRKLIKYDVTKSQKDLNAFLLELPNKFRIELSKIMQDNVLKKIIFFQDKEDLINFINPFLKQLKYSQNESLYKINDIPDEMYFIIKGTVIFQLSEEYANTEILEIKKHHNFCEIEMCLGEKMSHCIKIKTRFSELFMLRKNDFLKLSVNFQDIIQKFLNTSLMKYLKFNDEKKKIIKQYQKDHKEDFAPKTFKKITEDSLWQINESLEESSDKNCSNEITDNKSQSSKPKSSLSESNDNDDDSKSKKSQLSNQTDNNLSPIRKNLEIKSNLLSSSLNNWNYGFTEMKESINNHQKNIGKTIEHNIEKMIKILHSNKKKFDGISSKENPLKIFNKLKNATNNHERSIILQQLEELVNM